MENQTTFDRYLKTTPSLMLSNTNFGYFTGDQSDSVSDRAKGISLRLNDLKATLKNLKLQRLLLVNKQKDLMALKRPPLMMPVKPVNATVLNKSLKTSLPINKTETNLDRYANLTGNTSITTRVENPIVTHIDKPISLLDKPIDLPKDISINAPIERLDSKKEEYNRLTKLINEIDVKIMNVNNDIQRLTEVLVSEPISAVEPNNDSENQGGYSGGSSAIGNSFSGGNAASLLEDGINTAEKVVDKVSNKISEKTGIKKKLVLLALGAGAIYLLAK